MSRKPRGQRRKISASVSQDIIDGLDRVRGNFSRSAVIEAMLMDFLNMPQEMTLEVV